MKRSFFIAIVLALAAVVWIGSGQFGASDRAKVSEKPPADLDAKTSVPSVRVRVQQAEVHQARLTLRGQTEADRKVDIKAETNGRIVELDAEKGGWVSAGKVLARIDADERPARLAEAKSRLTQRRMEFKASKRLNKKGFRAETQLAAARADLDEARAAVKMAQMALDDISLKAPFDGLIVDRYVEIGDFVEMGNPVIRLIDLDPLLIVVQVSERDAGHLTTGTLATARLITGQEVEGIVSFISSEADPATRTFRVEAEVANLDGKLPDGASAEVTLPLRQVTAHQVSPAILTLSDSGLIGVKILGPENTAVFIPVQVIDEEPAGVWISGLPDRVVLITIGQEFIGDGQTVRPIDEKTLAPFVQGAGASTAVLPQDGTT